LICIAGSGQKNVKKCLFEVAKGFFDTALFFLKALFILEVKG